MVGISYQAQEALRARHACAESLVCGPVARPSQTRVVFYRLNRKFVDNERSIPKETNDIIYYTLSVGHHTGVIDCFAAELDCSYDDYVNFCKMLPEESESRYKMEGILRSGEITILQEDIQKIDADLRLLYANLDSVYCEQSPNNLYQIRLWLGGFLSNLDDMKKDRVVYLVGRELKP